MSSVVKDLNVKLNFIFTGDNLLEYYNPIIVESSKAQIIPNSEEAFNLDPITGRAKMIEPLMSDLENGVLVRMLLSYSFVARLNQESNLVKIATRLSPFFQATINELARYRNEIVTNSIAAVHTVNFKFPGTQDILRDMENSPAVEFRLYMAPKKKEDE